MSFTTVQDVETIIAVVVAMLTLSIGFVEYRRQGAQKRAEYFVEMWRRVKENKDYKRICDAIDDDDVALAEIPFKTKRDLLGLFEEVAMMVNSRLMRREVAYYMFGYYAIRCWDDKESGSGPIGCGARTKTTGKCSSSLCST